MLTECLGFSNGEAFGSSSAAPCANRPGGNTVIDGQSGQSWMSVPGFALAGGGGGGATRGVSAGWPAAACGRAAEGIGAVGR